MAELRRFDVEELLNRPGTYFNPRTEILIVVDDSASVDADLVAEEEDGEWVLLGDDVAIDEHRRDELVEAFETRRARGALREDADEDFEEVDELEPDAEPDEPEVS